MGLTTEKCELYPDTVITFGLFEDVENCAELQEKSKEEAIKVALINPKMVLDKLQLLAAVNKAVHLDQCNKKITKNVHSEIIFHLSGTKGFAETFKTYGISREANSPVLAVEVAPSGQSHMHEISKLIKGNLTDITRLSEMSDHKTIKEAYKVKDPELQVGTLLEAVVGRIATKDFVKYK